MARLTPCEVDKCRRTVKTKAYRYCDFHLLMLQHGIDPGPKRVMPAKDGYVKIVVNGVAVSEHRYVMMCKLGRLLTKDENVHHINGCRSDNRPENLELWSSSQPPGQRIPDKVAWAKELLAKYEPSALARPEQLSM